MRRRSRRSSRRSRRPRHHQSFYSAWSATMLRSTAWCKRLPHTSGIEDIERTRTELLALRAQAHREYMALPAPAPDAPSGPLRQLMALAAQNRKRALPISRDTGGR